jgi:hypothetical protein
MTDFFSCKRIATGYGLAYMMEIICVAAARCSISPISYLYLSEGSPMLLALLMPGR